MSSQVVRNTCFMALGLLASASVSLGAGLTCERMEYAQLKDSTKKELNDAYCSATRMADLNKDLRAIKQKLFEEQLTNGRDTSATMNGLKEYGEAQVSCLKVSDAVAAILTKKYNSKVPKSCG